MKPMLFKTQQDLMNFLQACPRPDGQARVLGQEMEASDMLQRCIALVPQIFEYRKVLAKGAGGLGSTKSVDRYAELAAANVSTEKMEAFDQSIANIAEEVELLLEAGGGDELADRLKGARTQVAYFTMVKESIEGFRNKLHKYMAKVEEKYADATTQLKAKQKELSKTLDSETVSTVIKEMNDKHATVQRLVEAMDEYCALQVGYNGILLGSR